MTLSLAIHATNGTELNYPAWVQTIYGLEDCVILRISSAGADIRLEEDKMAGDEFDLWLTRKGTCRRRCQLVESNRDHIRVQFKRDSASFALLRPAVVVL